MTKWTVEVRGALLQTYVIVILYMYRVSSVAVQYERRLHTYVGWLVCLVACMPLVNGIP